VHFIYLTKSKKRYPHTSLEIRQSFLDIDLAHLISMTVIRQGVPMGGDKSASQKQQNNTTTNQNDDVSRERNGAPWGQRICRLHPLSLPRHLLMFHPRCLFVRSLVCSFGWLLCCLSAPCCRASHSPCIAMPPRCSVSSLVLVSSLSSRCIAASCLASSHPSLCMMSTSRPSLAHLPWLDGTAWLDVC
jgi:hypothetical protein